MGQYYGKETGYVSEKEISTTKNRMIDEMIAEELKDEIIPEGDQEAARELCLEYGGNFGGTKNGGNSQFEHYLVDGAILQCDKAKKCGKWNRTTLHVSKNASQVNGRKMATVLDLDFEPFNIVCPLEETGGEERSCEELIWKAERWENMIRSTRYMTYCYGEGENTVKEEGLTMLSMLLCKHGGIITPVESGQSLYLDIELEILEKYSNVYEYANWSPDKKACAEAIWDQLYKKEGYDAEFVAGIIGNMFNEGNCGLLQYGKDWDTYLGAEFSEPMTISNIEQAKIVCLNTRDGTYGVGMVQWSDMKRKQTLYNNYMAFAQGEILTKEQLMQAEIKTISDELAMDYNNVCTIYSDNISSCDIADTQITFSTCVFFKKYETPNGHTQVSGTDYTVVAGVWEKAYNATKEEDIPKICKRIIAAKVAYEEFMNREDFN